VVASHVSKLIYLWGLAFTEPQEGLLAALLKEKGYEME